MHILPCLIGFTGKTEFRRLFKSRIRSVPEQAREEGAIPGGYELRELCGSSAQRADFAVKVTERYTRDAYYPARGADALLRGAYYVFFRGRQLRGSELALDELGFRAALVEPGEPARASELARAESVESRGLRELAEVSRLTLWELEQDVSPTSPNVAAYRYLALSRALGGFEGEEEYVSRFRADS